MNKLAVIVLLLGLAACSKKKPEEGRELAPGPTVGAQSAPMAGAQGAPAAPGPGMAPGAAPGGAAMGAAPGSAAGSGAAPAVVGCASASSLACAADQVDGCAGGFTTVHVCVAKDAKPGAPCAQPGAPCPTGQVDACLHDPPQSINHVCVVAAPAP